LSISKSIFPVKALPATFNFQKNNLDESLFEKQVAFIKKAGLMPALYLTDD
jgi:hypothetical protein